MKISESVASALSVQEKHELYSAYLYLGLSAWCAERNLDGMARWLEKQAGEEVTHAMKFHHYILERDGHVELHALERPAVKAKTALDVFEAAYEHEVKVTNLINDLVSLAEKEKDRATFEMLQWFVKEQVEEEAQTLAIVEQLKMAGDSQGALMHLDHRLGKRE